MKCAGSHADEIDDVQDRYRIVFVLLLLVGLAAHADDELSQLPLLHAGATHQGAIDLDVGQSERFRITVPEDAYAVRIKIDGAPVDLDLVVERTDGELFALGEEETYNETLFLTRIGDPPLESGTFSVSVVYQYADLPVLGGEARQSIHYRIRYEVIETHAEAELVPGIPRHGVLRPEDGMIQVYSIDVLEGVDELRLDVFDTEGDVDLFLNYGRAAVDPLTSDHLSQSYLGRESLTVNTAGHPPLREGTYYVTVLDQLDDEEPAEFSLVASFDGVPAVLLGSIPRIPVPTSPLYRVLGATVQIITKNGGGSGCVVSEAGHVLTSWHVVKNDADKADPSPVIAVSIDHEKPPQELFRAKVIRYSVEQDMALLLIRSGLYGQPLSRPLGLPYFHLGDPESLRFGDSLWFVGYPDVGGTGSRASITLTRGIVSGFERSRVGRIVKTDGEINEGNSGGAAVNENYELIGLPTRIVGQDAGQIAYIYPLSAMPDSWWRIIAP
jgi:S1-C subfamily serine protease